MPLKALLFAIVALALAGCGDDGGDTTVINNTTTVTESSPTTSTAAEPAEESVQPEKVEEYSGPCEPEFEVPAGAKAGYKDLETVLAECDYARQVAEAWTKDYGRDCYGGCKKVIEGIPCDFGGSAIVCSAAQTEVRLEHDVPRAQLVSLERTAGAEQGDTVRDIGEH